MDPLPAHQSTEGSRLNYRRFRAALDLRRISVEALARQAQRSSRHLWNVVTGRRRGSAELLAVIRQALGDDGYRFAIGETDMLRDAGADHAAR
jgi:transcriptional regulator with XRE-family HTH domain